MYVYTLYTHTLWFWRRLVSGFYNLLCWEYSKFESAETDLVGMYWNDFIRLFASVSASTDTTSSLLPPMFSTFSTCFGILASFYFYVNVSSARMWAYGKKCSTSSGKLEFRCQCHYFTALNCEIINWKYTRGHKPQSHASLQGSGRGWFVWADA